ncbi:DUF1330 domain-containing protein [Alphaproteobacteria bacterium]|jgi:uncharacterized protein (DUF1330 family)|nr:DUF1330 domain-containing protein [Alphaproteobacteria bacterium]
MPKGYLVSIYSAIHDEEKLAAYAKLAKPALESFGGNFIIRGMPAMVKENGVMNRTVVCEFPSLDVAKTAVESPAYAEALVALDGAAERDMRIVEGV